MRAVRTRSHAPPVLGWFAYIKNIMITIFRMLDSDRYIVKHKYSDRYFLYWDKRRAPNVSRAWSEIG